MRVWPVLLYCFLVGTAWYFLQHPIIVIAAGVAPMGGMLVIRYPYMVCLGFIIFSFFRIHEAFPFLNPLKLPLLLALGSLGVLGWHLFLSQKIEVFWSWELKWFSIFFALVSIGVVLSTNRGLAIAYYIGTYIKIGIMVFAIAWLSRTPGDFLMSSRLFILSGLSVGMVALKNKAAGIGLVEGSRVTIGREMDSVLGDPNDLSLVLLFPASFALALVFASSLSRFERLLSLVAFFVLISSIIATQSRGGLLGIMSISGYYTWHKVKSKMVLIGGGSILAPILLAVAGISDRSSGGSSEEGLGESSMGRIYAWGAGWNMAVAHPLTGVGLDNFFNNYYFYSAHWDGLNHAVHSTWFGILAETGFLGFGVFLTLLIGTLKGLQRSLNMSKKLEALQIERGGQLIDPFIRPYVYAVIAGFISFMISGTFLTQGFTWPFYVLLSLAVALIRHINNLAQKAGLG